MTKIALFPWCSAVIKTAGKCELMPEQSGFLTGSTFLPWRSLVVPGDVFTTFEEAFEERCGESYPLIHTEGFEDRCGSHNLEKEEGWES